MSLPTEENKVENYITEKFRQARNFYLEDGPRRVKQREEHIKTRVDAIFQAIKTYIVQNQDKIAERFRSGATSYTIEFPLVEGDNDDDIIKSYREKAMDVNFYGLTLSALNFAICAGKQMMGKVAVYMS